MEVRVYELTIICEYGPKRSGCSEYFESKTLKAPNLNYKEFRTGYIKIVEEETVPGYREERIILITNTGEKVTKENIRRKLSEIQSFPNVIAKKLEKLLRYEAEKEYMWSGIGWM